MSECPYNTENGTETGGCQYSGDGQCSLQTSGVCAADDDGSCDDEDFAMN